MIYDARADVAVKVLVPVLVSLLNNVDPEARTFAAEAPARFAFKADKVAPAPVKVLADPGLGPRPFSDSVFV